MGKHLTEAKYISKKIKYGKLQKLKWYCSICNHQCNDSISFRIHVQTEKHRMMMSEFRNSSNSILESNSKLFEAEFLNVLKSSFPNKEVRANTVYIQVIKDKNHIHMNSTKWESLRGFCENLKIKNKIEMKMTETGPIIKLISENNNISNKFENNEDLTQIDLIQEKINLLPEIKFDEPIEEIKNINFNFKKIEKKNNFKISNIFKLKNS